MISITLSSNRPHIIILNGFDRSGGSAISRSLAQHPEVELFMQPFNSGPVRRKMYQIWNDDVATDEDVKFFEGLEKAEILRDYIKSHWFEKYSTTQSFIPGRVHLIKTTLNHFLIDWCQVRFPGIDQWAIWRNPWEILISLIRNEFIGEWYVTALEELSPVVRTTSLLAPFRKFLGGLDNPHAQAAYLIAVRSYFLFNYVKNDRVIFYEDFYDNPSNGLSGFLNAYNLVPLEIEAGKDLNIAGTFSPDNRKAIELVDLESIELISSIFAVLTDLIKTKFPERRLSS